MHAGSSFVEIAGQYMDVGSIIVHENFNDMWDNDIGLMILHIALQLDDVSTAAISLPSDDLVLQDDDAVFVTGFGSVEV